MTVILKELFERYCLTIEEVKPFLSKKYNINNVQDDLVLEHLSYINVTFINCSLIFLKSVAN